MAAKKTKKSRSLGQTEQLLRKTGWIMSRFANLPRPSFARPTAPAERSPGGNLCRGLTRRAAMLHEAAAVLTVLPAPGEALHALITGRYDLMHPLVCLLERLGPARAVRRAGPGAMLGWDEDSQHHSRAQRTSAASLMADPNPSVPAGSWLPPSPPRK